MIARLFGQRLAEPSVDGQPARIPGNRRIYAIGDIHGRFDLLCDLEARIVEDCRDISPTVTKCAVFLGDFVDRGLESKAVIEHLSKSVLPEFDKVFLCGNHDFWLRNFVEGAGASTSWIMSGAEATLLSYGVAIFPDPSSPKTLATIRTKVHGRMPPGHRRFLQQLQLYHREGDYLFVHAGVRPGIQLDDQDPQDFMTIREPFLSYRGDYGFVVAHGHTIAESPEVRANRIGIDTGAFATGRLTALVLEADTYRFLSTDG